VTTYIVGPVDGSRGNCTICGCRLQNPYRPATEDAEWGSIWLTPWMDCGGECTTCMAHAGDPDCIEALEHWLQLTKASAND